ncbi:MAG: hypothetical protein R3181_03285 [Rubricoccaceae bacterium]|nr:hypothetical protein [Rubricoccaceae bacterium]
MGQQQLLLLVLGIVIVGLAVVVGIQAFGENQKKSNADALVNDAVRIASDAQAWVLKPSAFGGGEGDFSSLDFDDIGYTAAAGVYQNLNGRFQLSNITAGGVTIDACDEQAGFDNTVTAVVSGTAPEDIATTVATAACTF